MSRPNSLIRKCRLIRVLVICHQLISSVAYSSEPDIRIHKKSELLKLLSRLEWGVQGPYSSKPLPITPDIVITAPINISASDIPTPASCRKRNDCRHAVALGYSRPVQGIHCEETKNFMGRQSCKEIVLSPGKYRFRGIMFDTHPSRYNFTPLLEVFSSSAEPCREGEFPCTGNHTCHSGFNEYCRLCLGYSAEECACRNPSGSCPTAANAVSLFQATCWLEAYAVKVLAYAVQDRQEAILFPTGFPPCSLT